MTVRGAVLMVAATFVACQSDKAARVDFSETARHYTEADYHDVYERWTRHDFVMHDVEKAIEVWATFKSWEWREAYIERYASVYSLSEGDRSKLRAGQLSALHDAYEFNVTAQSANYKWNDLEKQSSPWRITLLDALGHELQVDTAVIKVQKLPEPYEREFFPAKTPFTKMYSVRFVAPANSDFVGIKSGSIILRIASPVGRIELTWRA